MNDALSLSAVSVKTENGKSVLTVRIANGEVSYRFSLSRDQLFALNKDIVGALCPTRNYPEEANQPNQAKETESGA